MVLWKIYFWLFLIIFCVDFLKVIKKIFETEISKHKNKILGSLFLIPLLISNFLWAYNKLWLGNLFWRVYFFFAIGFVLFRLFLSKSSSVKSELKYELMENPSDFYIGVGFFVVALAPAFVALFLYAFF